MKNMLDDDKEKKTFSMEGERSRWPKLNFTINILKIKPVIKKMCHTWYVYIIYKFTYQLTLIIESPESLF